MIIGSNLPEDLRQRQCGGPCTGWRGHQYPKRGIRGYYGCERERQVDPAPPARAPRPPDIRQPRYRRRGCRILNERQRTLFRLNRLGYVFQDYALVPELTAEENIYLPSKVRGMTAKECTRACRDILGLVGLRDRVSFLPGEMSGGEQQRVAIARALINNPAILLADEPCANLDTRNSP